MTHDTPAHIRLAWRLRDAKAPVEMIEAALRGYYGDFSSPLATPITQLVLDCSAAGLLDVAKEAMNGDFDGR